MKKYFFIKLFILFFLNISFAQTDGKFNGVILITPTQSLEYSVNIFLDSGNYKAVIDIPSQGVKGFPLSEVKVSKDSVKFMLPNPQANAYFAGKIITNDSIAGEFSQAKYIVPFYMTRELANENVNLLFNSENISFSNGTNYFSGTLTTPLKNGKHPAAVLITGSGSQDRDENIYGFKIFKIIAEHLTKNGIAVLRYDDRNFGESKGTPVDSSTSKDFSEDVLEAVKYLRTRDDIDPNQIGLIGHSEGGLIAPMAANTDGYIAFAVLLAGPSVPGKDIILKQTEMILRISGSTEQEIAESISMTSKLINAAITNGDYSGLKDEIINYFIGQYSKLPEDMKGTLDSQTFANESYNSYLKAFSSNWMKYFLAHDPKADLEKIKCPVLALFGEKDLQVPVVQNETPMKEYLKNSGNKLFTVKIIESANHLFQKAETGSPSEYQTLAKEFTPGFLEYITTWIKSFVNIAN